MRKSMKKNQKALVVTIVLFLALISLGCSASQLPMDRKNPRALRPTYPGFTGGYALARKKPVIQKRTTRAKKTIAEQTRDLQAAIRLLRRRNNTLLSGPESQKVTAEIRKNKGFIKKHQAKCRE